jgi:5'-nucleotidase
VRILLTNDDGIDAAGIVALKDALSPEHEVWVVAPESNRSGASHAISLREASRVRKRGERSFSGSGSPADCVLVAALGVVPEPIDLVLSGVNHGPNLGTDIIYSGTAAGAREGTIHGIPGVALSLCQYEPPFDFRAAAEFVRANALRLRDLCVSGSFLNVNFPADGGGYRGVALTVPCVRAYRDRLVTYESPRGELYCFLSGELPGAVPEELSDHTAVSRGYVSVSRVETTPGRVAFPAGAADALEGFLLPS